ncbi:unnamed protein product, partial [Rotaria magnacalcarata]
MYLISKDHLPLG